MRFGGLEFIPQPDGRAYNRAEPAAVDSATLNKIGIAAFLIVWPFAMYHAVHSILRGPVQLTTPVDVDAVIRQFAHRRRIFIRSLLVVLSGFLYVFLIQAVRPSGPGGTLLGLPFAAHIIGGFVVIAVGIATGAFVYRCPACGSPPWAPMGGGDMGVDLNPVACPTCGTPLR